MTATTTTRRTEMMMVTATRNGNTDDGKDAVDGVDTADDNIDDGNGQQSKQPLVNP